MLDYFYSDSESNLFSGKNLKTEISSHKTTYKIQLLVYILLTYQYIYYSVYYYHNIKNMALKWEKTEADTSLKIKRDCYQLIICFFLWKQFSSWKHFKFENRSLILSILHICVIWKEFTHLWFIVMNPIFHQSSLQALLLLAADSVKS